MWRKITGILVILVIDQATKLLAQKFLSESQSIPIIGTFMQFTLVYNENGVWGLRFHIPYIPFMIVAIIVIIFLMKKMMGSRYSIPLSLILAGAIGNLIDRTGAMGHLTGKIGNKGVVDFIDFGIGNLRWPVFNIADSSISVGIVLWLIIGFIESSRSKTQRINNSQ